MSKNKYRFGIVGTGVISEFHIKALQQMEEAELVTICDIVEEKAKKYGEAYKIKWTANYEEMISDPNIDVVSVVVPSGLHADLGVKAANAGKHVIVEKPIDISLEKADILINACRKKNVTLGVISQLRYLESMQKVYDIVESGKLGKILQGDAYIKWYRSDEYYSSGGWRGTKKMDGGGACMNQGVHFVDLLLSVMGPVKSVVGKVKTAARKIEVEDLGMAMIEFESGAYGVIQASTAMYPGFPARFEINGTKGTIVFENNYIKFMHLEGEEPYNKKEGKKGGFSDPKNIDVSPYISEYKDIIGAITEKREPKVSGVEARKALELILAIYKSSEINKAIELPLIY